MLEIGKENCRPHIVHRESVKANTVLESVHVKEFFNREIFDEDMKRCLLFLTQVFSSLVGLYFGQYFRSKIHNCTVILR